MHVKLNVINLFNRLSLLANQNTSTSIQTMSIVSEPSKKSPSVETSSKHKHIKTLIKQKSFEKVNDINNKVTNSQVIIMTNNILNPSGMSKNRQKLIMSSSYQLYEDDLSKIDVKSLKEKYSSAIEKHSLKLSSTGASSIGYLSIRKDISVKHLCRSFGDLSTLNNEESNTNYFQHVYKSSFSKFDALQKKNLQSLQNGKGGENGCPDGEKKCHACEKVVFQMEQIKAEKKFWHRSCFRCVECSKQLNVDTYQSHEGILYCKQHFKTLFSPKIVEDNNEPIKVRKHEMIILENQPIELPPDVIRSSDKADLGLDELHQINLRQRFQLFENAGQQESKVELDKANNVKRSTSILSKLARFQAKGMDVGVVDDNLNGISYENSSTEEEDEDELDDENHEDIELIRAKRAQKEKPMSFKEMYDIKSKFESGQLMNKEERREERKQELQNIRSRLFMGKQAKIKEMYQQAVAESEQTITSSSKKSDVEIGDKAKSIMEMFEKGEIYDENDMKKTLKDDELAMFEKGISKQSRSLFLELDATASKLPNHESSSSANLKLIARHTPRQNSQTIATGEDIVRSDQKIDDVQIETADIVSKFKFFEAYQPPEKEKKSFRITPPRDYQGLTKLTSPEKEVYRDPHIARNEKRSTDQDEILELQKTASKVLSMFRQMEENKEEKPYGPKPLKRFTPPPEGERGRFVTNDDSGPDYSDEDDDDECSEEESEDESNYIKSSQKDLDEFLKAAQSAERAKKLREKFEKWEENEIKKEMNNSSINLYDEEKDEGQMETAKSLKARFEQMQNEEPKLPTNRPKVNRFV
ncbi:golgin subfamily A member 6-like protein 22 isoform X3 [Chironomus tepperi]|uniref:golgin subfamily A member 6-like protein 22 isoform X3 n=1 Tax=Chironomus tepperi TaxID=113505 RepID=UPI00391F718B